MKIDKIFRICTEGLNAGKRLSEFVFILPPRTARLSFNVVGPEGVDTGNTIPYCAVHFLVF